VVGDASRGSGGVGRLGEALGVEPREREVCGGDPNLLVSSVVAFKCEFIVALALLKASSSTTVALLKAEHKGVK